MAKKKKRSAPSNRVREAADETTSMSKSAKFRLMFLLIGIFLVLGLLYVILLYRCVIWASPVLYTAAAVLFLSFYFVNRGFSGKPVEKDVLPDTWSDEKKDAFCEEDRRRKAFAKKLMIPMVPVLLLVIVDIIFTVLIPILRG